jgi:hypothetical protein
MNMFRFTACSILILGSIMFFLIHEKDWFVESMLCVIVVLQVAYIPEKSE